MSKRYRGVHPFGVLRKPRYLIAFVAVVAFGAWTFQAMTRPQVDLQRPMETLYHLRLQAAQTGWTPIMHQQAGSLYELMGDLPAAAAHREAATPITPEDLRQLAANYLAMSAWTSARETLDKLLQADSSNSYAHFQLGLLLAPSDPLSAAEHLTIASSNPVYRQSAQALLDEVLDFENPTPLSIRVGLRFLAESRFDHAERAFTFALFWDAPETVALAYNSLARTQQGKDGRVLIESAVNSAPDSPSVQFAYGLYLREVGDYVASRDALARAAQLDPNQAAYYAELGTAAQLLHQIEEAAYFLLLAVRTSGNAPEYIARLTRFYTQEDYAVDPAFLEELLAGMPADAGTVAVYGWSLFESGDINGALEQIDLALERDPANIDATYYKARVLLESGQLAEALPLLDTLGNSASPRQAWALQTQDILRQTLPELTPEAATASP